MKPKCGPEREEVITDVGCFGISEFQEGQMVLRHVWVLNLE